MPANASPNDHDEGMRMLRERMAASPPSQPPEQPAELGAVILDLRGQRRLERRVENAADFAEKEKKLQEAKRRKAMYTVACDLGQRYTPKLASLDAYSVYHANQKPIVERVKKLSTRIAAHVANAGGLILYGNVGTGKDHLMAALLYSAASHSIACRWFNGQEIFGRFRDNMDTGQRDEEFYRQMDAPTVLAISDPIPPSGSLSNWDIGNFYRIVDRRYRLMRPTWVTINADSPAEADTKLSEPVFDRLRECAEILPCFWPSHRRPL